MGKVYSMLMRPIRTFNIANRAEKIISREKPVPAPHHASTKKQKALFAKANPNFLEDHYRKDLRLDQRLKDVFVTSTDPQEEIKPASELKSLPQNRHSIDDSMFDFYESTMIPEGKCSLKQVFTFLIQHKRDPIAYSSENIAIEYKMDKKIVDDILKYFKVYVTAIPNNPRIEEDYEFEKLYKEAAERRKNKKEKIMWMLEDKK